nr:zinc finger protein 2 [Crassostrea gigas]
MTEYKRQPKEDVCHLLQSVILQICEEHYQSRGDVEVDAIICLSTLDSESQDVVKIHKVLPSGNRRRSFESETEEQYSNLTPKEEFVEEKQVVEDSGDTDEFQLWSAQIKSELYSHNPEEDEDLFGETESNQDNVDMETRHSSPGQVETPPRKVLKLENKRVTQSLRHSESKVFQCSKCGSGFSSKKSQMRHERYNCGDIPHFECNVCGKFYSRADSKTRHLWKIHGIKISTPDKNNPTDFP